MSELDPQARRILLAARAARSPEATDKARVRRRLAATLGGAAVAAQATQAAATASSQTVASASSTVASTALPTATGGATKGALGALGNLAKPVLAKWIVGSTLAVGVGVGTHQLVLEQQPSTPPPSSVQPPVAPAPTEAPQALPPTPDPDPSTPEPSPSTTARPRRPPAAQPRPPASLATELALLQRAQQAWRAKNPTQALRVLKSHRQRFPASQLQVERDALRVLCLCEVGRVQPARRLARRLLQTAPDSPLRRTVEASCAME